MRVNALLFSRSAMLEAESLPYEYESIQRQQEEWCMEQSRLGHSSVSVPSEFHKGDFSKLRHQAIDRLTKTTPSTRSPDNHIPQQVFENLMSRIEASAKKVKEHVNHFLAHAASREKRQPSNVDQISITFDELMKTHQTLCETASFITLELLGESTGQWLAYPQYDQFEFLDVAFCSTENLVNVRDKWGTLNEESHAWSNWGVDEYEKEFTQQQRDAR
jgi:hypothetical protein